MADFSWLNPFGRLLETEASPYSRTLRTGFFGKLIDAFWMFAGPTVFSEESRYVGIFDYLTLFVFFGLDKLYQWSIKHGDNDDPFKWVLLTLTFIPGLVATVARIGFSIGLTILSSPFVFIANLYIDYSSQWHANRYKQSIYNMVGTEHSYKTTPEPLTLGEFLKRHRLGLEDLTMRPYETSHTEKVIDTAQAVGSGTINVVKGLGALLGIGTNIPKSRKKKLERRSIGTLSLFYKHPEETSCLPSCTPNWNDLLCFYCICPNALVYQGGKYGVQRIEEIATYAVQGIKQDEFLITLYEDDSQIDELDALFRLNVGHALCNTHLNIQKETPDISTNEKKDEVSPPDIEDLPTQEHSPLFRYHPS